MKRENLYRLVCRPALPKDTPEVMALTAQIWDGQDYVPYVWEDWLEDPEGLVVVAEYGGRVVGLYKLACLTPEDGWLQGLRVHPDYQQRGFARHIHQFVLEHWEAASRGRLRLSTGAENMATQRLCAQTGFEKINEIMGFTAPPLPDPFEGWVLLQETQVENAYAYSRSCPTMQFCRGLIDQVWEWATLSPDHIRKACQEERAWYHPETGSWMAWIHDEDEGEPQLHVQLVACSLEFLPELLSALRRLAHQMNIPQVRWAAPLVPELEAGLESTGFKREWDNPLFLFERNILGVRE
jgi:GNAT superfamily N-acetyltransferase